MVKEEIINLVKIRMTILEINKKELAKRSGIEYSSICKILKHKTELTAQMADKLLQAVGVNDIKIEIV